MTKQKEKRERMQTFVLSSNSPPPSQATDLETTTSSFPLVRVGGQLALDAKVSSKTQSLISQAFYELVKCRKRMSKKLGSHHE